MNPLIKAIKSEIHERYMKITAEYNSDKLSLSMKTIANRKKYLIIFSLYASVSQTLHKSFYKDNIMGPKDLKENENTSFVIAGDFNDYQDGTLDRDPSDHSNISDKRCWPEVLGPILESKRLLDSF